MKLSDILTDCIDEAFDKETKVCYNNSLSDENICLWSKTPHNAAYIQCYIIIKNLLINIQNWKDIEIPDICIDPEIQDYSITLLGPMLKTYEEYKILINDLAVKINEKIVELLKNNKCYAINFTCKSLENNEYIRIIKESLDKLKVDISEEEISKYMKIYIEYDINSLVPGFGEHILIPSDIKKFNKNIIKLHYDKLMHMKVLNNVIGIMNHYTWRV